MSTRRSNRRIGASKLLGAALCALAPLAAVALSTDRQQPMDIKANYSKIVQGNEKTPGTTFLRGDVQVVQGSMKAHGAEATIYQHPSTAKDAKGNDISGEIQRVVLVGKQAHLEQQQDNGTGVMTADADKIDYNNDTSVAVLTGNVTVVQQGRGTFHGEKMTYNTNTGEMESGDSSPGNRVHMVIQPKAKPAADKPAPDKPADAQPKKVDTDGQP
ncbi:lipopolysaccharide transport periplasmic protein LptA [Dokdonella sp.]|uniref:lipopolysaccharide transport periplasmic protein LptA n=1 Tax=Dokdonella sp. TaxID=2291710 RepID=UPI001B26C2F4|nr:lipopolysaccharide transport periplasmic protein LptA [Dokdonella sp.]MBO9663249.1 lipopolysaccharide transport periplasmic protein LptA [Dokdonella sp.]